VDVAALAGSVALGAWLLAAPSLIGLDGGARISHLVAGPIAAGLAVIAMSAVTRLVVRANVVIGAWLVVAPLVLDHGAAWMESVAAGALLGALALVPRGQGHRFAGGWTALVRGEPRGPGQPRMDRRRS
jgi:hypothetical protein